MFIKQLKLSSNLSKLNDDCRLLIDTVGWGKQNQICLNTFQGANDPWFDGIGSLIFDNKFQVMEQDFKIFNDIPDYLKTQILQLQDSEKIRLGRIRLMKLAPKTGLSVHYDLERRYHLALETNKYSYFCFNNTETTNELEPQAQCFHIPSNGYWYEVNTKLVHWVYNGGKTDRIHIVISTF